MFFPCSIFLLFHSWERSLSARNFVVFFIILFFFRFVQYNSWRCRLIIVIVIKRLWFKCCEHFANGFSIQLESYPPHLLPYLSLAYSPFLCMHTFRNIKGGCSFDSHHVHAFDSISESTPTCLPRSSPPSTTQSSNYFSRSIILPFLVRSCSYSRSFASIFHMQSILTFTFFT